MSGSGQPFGDLSPLLAPRSVAVAVWKMK